MKFLIQTINGQIKHDFSITLLESIEYQKWLNRDIFEYRRYFDTDGATLKGYIPIGSNEFVCKYLFDHFGLTPKPINIPNELMKFEFTGREVINGTEKDVVGKKFVKSNDKIKLYTEICDSAPQGNYQISDIINIDSEWEMFCISK